MRWLILLAFALLSVGCNMGSSASATFSTKTPPTTGAAPATAAEMPK